MNKAFIYSKMENAIARIIHENFGIEAENGVYEYSMMASPNYHIVNGRGYFSCDTFTYRIYMKEKPDECELHVKRIDAEFTIREEEIKLDTFRWYIIQSMIPWKYQDDKKCTIHILDEAKRKNRLPKIGVKDHASDRIQIRNLQNYFFEKQMSAQSELFTKEKNASFFVEDYTPEVVEGIDAIQSLFREWKKREDEDQGRYVMQCVSGAPVIEVDETGKSAVGVFVVEIFCTNKMREKDTLIRSLYQLKSTYVKEDEWKICSMYMEKFADLPRESYTGGVRYDHMSKCPGEWIGGNEKQSGNSPEDIYEIETILSHWFYACRRGELQKFYMTDMKNPEVDTTLFIKSQGEKSKKCIGEAEIIGRLSGMDRLYNPGQYSYHTATTPVIEISEDGLTAKGTWFDQSATNLMNPQIPQDVISYMIFVFRYMHEFRKVNGKWYLVHFFAKPLISMQDWAYEPKTTLGWVKESKQGYYPLPKGEEVE